MVILSKYKLIEKTNEGIFLLGLKSMFPVHAALNGLRLLEVAQENSLLRQAKREY